MQRFLAYVSYSICRTPNNSHNTHCVQCGFPLQMIDLPVNKSGQPKLSKKTHWERGPLPPITRYQLPQMLTHQICRVVQPQLKRDGRHVQIDLPTECNSRAVQALANQINQELHTDAKALLLKWSKLLRNFYQQTATYQRFVSQSLEIQHLQQTPAPAKTSQIHQAKFNFKQSQILIHRYLAIIRSD